MRFTLQRYLEEKPFKVNKIEVFREEYAGPYTGGRELPSSCGAEPGFGEDERCAEEAALEHIQASMCATLPSGAGALREPLVTMRMPLPNIWFCREHLASCWRQSWITGCVLRLRGGLAAWWPMSHYSGRAAFAVSKHPCHGHELWLSLLGMHQCINGVCHVRALC